VAHPAPRLANPGARLANPGAKRVNPTTNSAEVGATAVAIAATRQSRNRSQAGLKRRDAEGAEDRGGEELLLSPFSAFLSESQHLCVNSSQPARILKYSSTKSPPFPPPRPRPARPKPEPRHRATHLRSGMGQSPAKSTQRLNAASSSRSELPREAFGVRPACWRCRKARVAREREQAPRTPNASRNSAADRNVSAPQPMRMSRRDA
jgi:hypothetical protein